MTLLRRLSREVAEVAMAEHYYPVMFSNAIHETGKVLDPRIMTIPVQKIDTARVVFFLFSADVERISGFAIVVVEAE